MGTQVRAGECDGGKCVPSTDFTTDYVTTELEECSTTVFLVQFDAEKGGSRESAFECNVGTSTNAPGASPKFWSNDLATCNVKHIGLPEWLTSEYSDTVNELCWAQDVGVTGVATNDFVDTDDVAAYEAAGGFCYDLDSSSSSNINLVVQDQNAVRGQSINDDSSLTWPSQVAFHENSIAELYEM